MTSRTTAKWARDAALDALDTLMDRKGVGDELGRLKSHDEETYDEIVAEIADAIEFAVSQEMGERAIAIQANVDALQTQAYIEGRQDQNEDDADNGMDQHYNGGW